MSWRHGLATTGRAARLVRLTACGSPCAGPARRAAPKERRSKMNLLRVMLPSVTVMHSAPGALATGTVSVSYMISAVVSSPKAAISLEPVRVCTNDP